MAIAPLQAESTATLMQNNDVTVITRTDDLKAICQKLSSSAFVTVDTEFMREKTYWPQVCLIQLAGPEDAVCIDPQADGLDMEPLFELLKNEQVLKVFHAARQDMEIFFHISGALPKPIFDTQIAAMVCGFGDSVGYETLVTSLAKESIDKSSRFTDWSIRPLSDKQLRYAVSDVTHLRAVYNKLKAKLEANNRASWLAAEMDILTAIETYDIDPQTAYQRLKLKTKKPRVFAIAQAVAAWRETEARTRDIPRSRILKDEQVMEVAHHAPKSANDLARTRGLSQKMAEGHQGQGILKAVQKALSMPIEDCPQPAERKDLPDGTGPTADLLKVLLKMVCQEQKVAQKLLANAADIELLAGLGEDAGIPALKGWRREVFGETALKVMRGDIGFAIRKGKIIQIPAPD